MIKYPASYARMRGLKGKLMGRNGLEDFLNTPDLQAALSVLTRSYYGENFQDSTDLHQIEHGLKQDLIVSYIKILTFLRGSSGCFFQCMLSRFELLSLKSIVRWLAQKDSPEESPEPFIFSLGKYNTLHLEEALETEDLEACVALMKDTPYARALEIGYEQYKEDGELFPIELALDQDYYQRLWRAMKSLGPVDQINVGRLLGIQYDITNLLWILRFKEYYGFSPEQIFQYTVPHGWKIKEDTFRMLAENEDVAKTINETQIEPYTRVFQSAKQVDGNFVMGLDIALSRYLYRESRETLTKFHLQASVLVAFFLIKEMEIRDIITIISGRNLGLSQERIRSYLITL
ncbi:hypothetical protein GF312_08275 [Candidatus Poribacteria bacterium]|nr:hypothetical protein [Candidatus Poribacteria bacterium]